MTTREIRELRGQMTANSEAMATLLSNAKAAGRSLTGAEQARFDSLTAANSELRVQLDTLEDERDADLDQMREHLATSRGRKVGDHGVTIEDSRRATAELALRAWALGDQHAKPEHIAAAQQLGVRYRAAELELRTLSSVTATQGQASVPDEIMRAFWDAQKWYGRVRNVATVLPTTTGAPLPIPTTDDTANTGEIIAESGPVTTTVDPAFGQVVLTPKKYSSKAVIVPVELLQDSAINLADYLGRKLGERIARKQNSDFTVGAGTTVPWGVVTQASLGKTATATNAITWDEVIDLIHSTDVAYRSMPSFRLMMHDTTAAFLRKLKDSQNRYLWEQSVQAGEPSRAFGVPVEINNDMSSTFATNNRLVLAGAFEAYHIQDAGQQQILRADELRILNHQVVFLAYQRSDGALVDTAAVKYLRTA